MTALYEPDMPELVDADHIARAYHEALAEDMSQIPPHCAEVLAAVPGLLAQLRAAHWELDELRAGEQRHEYAVTDGDLPAENGRRYPRERAEAARDQLSSTAWVRTITTGPWAELIEPPF